MTIEVETAWADLSSRLRKFIRSRVGDEATADDLLQDVFLKISRRGDDWENSRHLEAWLFRVARNAVIDHYRTRRENVEFDDVFADENAADPECYDELKSGFRRMVDELPEMYRNAIVLTEFEGLSQVELAERLGISVSGAKSRVQRARKELRKMLEDCCRFEFDRRGRVIDCLPHTSEGCAECD
jgi:RNA polymerase sigma-70 factor (ECF subfamily)